MNHSRGLDPVIEVYKRTLIEHSFAEISNFLLKNGCKMRWSFNALHRSCEKLGVVSNKMRSNFYVYFTYYVTCCPS